MFNPFAFLGLGGGGAPAQPAQAQPQQQQQSSPLGGVNPFSLMNMYHPGATSMSGMFSPAFYAMMIGLGKNLESRQPNSPLGQGLLATLGPSASQIMKDPVGMGLPTLFGLPFLTPFTSSKAAQATKPEWQKLFPLGS